MNHGQGRNRKGYLYRRWQKKIRYRGLFHRKEKEALFAVQVDGRGIEQSLKTANLEEAQKLQASIMKSLELANKRGSAANAGSVNSK